MSMNLNMPYTRAHPAVGEEVIAMDDADVHVCYASVENTSDEKERMSNYD
jgi:hypothetical protein